MVVKRSVVAPTVPRGAGRRRRKGGREGRGKRKRGMGVDEVVVLGVLLLPFIFIKVIVTPPRRENRAK